MSLKKTVAIAAAVGALAAISVPAMAMENEFHGTYTFNGIFSNFQDGGSGDYSPTQKKDSAQMNNYFEQRGRLQYIAKVSDDLKLVTQFELDTRFGGINTGKYTNTTDSGVLDADGVNFETKHLYLDFNLGQNFNSKLGVQPYKDTLKGLFIDADLPAINTTTKLGAYTLGLGYSRFAEDYQSSAVTTGLTRLGDGAKDLFFMDNSFEITKDTKVAFSYYLLADYTATATGGSSTALLDNHTKDQAILLNTFALSAETKLGPLSLSGFGAMQAGHQKGGPNTATTTGPTSTRYFHGYAANATAKMAVGPGTAKAALLFTSGDNSTNAGSYKGWVSTGVNSYNDGGMMILVRATQNSPTSTDRYIRKIVTNVALATLGYDANLTDKVFANGNVGFGFAPASKGAPVDKSISATSANASDFIGTEFNLESGYKVSSNLTLRAQAAYMVLGGYYKGSALNSAVAASKDPENPYTMRILASLKF
jgi:hypothetical protein